MWHCHEKRCHEVICQRRNSCCATRTGVCSHWFPLCIGQVFQSRPALGLCMTCLSPIVIFIRSSSFTFSDDSFLASLPSLPLHLLFGCTPICTGTRLLSAYSYVLVISRISSRICIQFAILVLSPSRYFRITSTLCFRLHATQSG